MLVTRVRTANVGGDDIVSTHFDSYSEARARLREVLDAAEAPRVVTVRRDGAVSAVVDAARLRAYLAAIGPARAQLVAEDEGWSIFVPGVPVAADGATVAEAVAEMIDALREYAVDWQDRLKDAPNHGENWGIVQLISLSSDDQLREWLVGPE